MRAATQRTKPGRLGSWIGGSAGVGAIVVALLMALSPAAAAATHPNASFKGASWTPNVSVSTSGCGTTKSTSPKFSALTGIVTWSGTSNAIICGKVVQGVGASSSASSSGGVTVTAPLKLTTGVGGVNVSWSILASWGLLVNASKKLVCVSGSSYGYSYYDSYINSWINYTYHNSYCSIYANVDVSSSVYVFDATSGSSFYPSNYWGGFYKSLDRSASRSTTVETYSNASYWSSNYTSYYTNGYSSGSVGSGNLAMTPTFFINGTFVKSDKYFLIASIGGTTSATANNLAKGKVMATLNMGTAPNGADLSVVVW